MSDPILWELADNGVLTITINRPEVKNALDTAMQTSLPRLFNDAARHPKVKVVVFTGAGGSFCTGADLRGFGAPDPNDAIALEFGQTEQWNGLEMKVDRLLALHQASLLLHKMGKPTIAKLRGPAAGMGFSLALACDFRLAADNAFLTTGFSKIGMSGDFGGSYFLTQLVGPSKAKEIYMFSDRVGAAEAQQLGLFNRVVPDAELDATVDAFANRLTEGAGLALRYVKENIHAAVNQTVEQVLELEAKNMIRCRLTQDCNEAVKAFMEKRTPVFRGL